MIGAVSAWNEVRGYGFIQVGCGMPDLLFLSSGLKTPVSIGDQVDYWIGDNPDGSNRDLAVDIAVRGAPVSRELPPRLFVGNLPAGVTQEQLREALQAVGPTLRIIKYEAESFGFVDFVDPADYNRARRNTAKVTMFGHQLRFRPVEREPSVGTAGRV